MSARGGCGPEAPCGRSLAAMEQAHRQALEELQRQHGRQMKELEREKDRLLLEETQDTARGQPGRTPRAKSLSLRKYKKSVTARGSWESEVPPSQGVT